MLFSVTSWKAVVWVTAEVREELAVSDLDRTIMV
jgi:hypothetical protein